MEKKRIDAIIGAIAGDIIGSAYEFKGVEQENFKVFDKNCSYTDDSVLTIAVTDWLTHPGGELQDFLIRYARKYYDAGYGPQFGRWCMMRYPRPYNSCGNGSAMRVSAVGCVANSVEEALELAKDSALPTHNHPEGIKGAQAIAVAIVLARQGKTKDEIKTTLQVLFDYDLNRTYLDLYNGEHYCPLKVFGISKSCWTQQKHYVVPEGVKRIADFGGNPFVETITVKQFVELTTSDNFASDTNLKRVDFQGGVKGVTEFTYYNCPKLENK